MNKKEKAAFILKTLEELFPHPKLPLKCKDPYTMLIAVLLSAQCTDEKVNQATPHLFALADTPLKMASLPLASIEKTIKTLGLYRTKAKNIKALSQILLEKYQGKVPSTFEELEELPGVGHKTASVVMIQAFHQTAFPVDTHVHRLAKRWGLSAGKDVKTTEKDLKALFPENKWNTVSLQIILFGRKYCPARTHQPGSCPICSHILSRKV
jgi:endonuclease-3